MSAPSRTQLDQTGERIRDGKATPEDWDVLAAYRLSVRDEVAPLLEHVRATAKRSGFPFTARVKTNYSIEQKLRRTTIRLRQIDDVMGCRVIVPDRVAQDTFTASIATIGKAKVRDRRVNPSNGYRAVHVILGDRAYLEVQVRTKYQDAWAELSERVADRQGIDVKYGGGSKDTRFMLDMASLYIDWFESGSVPHQLEPEDMDWVLQQAHRELL